MIPSCRRMAVPCTFVCKYENVIVDESVLNIER